jgi:hypothetical protein
VSESRHPAPPRRSRRIPLLAAGASLTCVAGLVLAADLFMGYRDLTRTRSGDQSDGLHVPDEFLGWSPTPGGVGRHRYEGRFDVEYRMDAEGFREVPHRGAPQRQLWLFGDSFTFGQGVANEDAYPNRIARDYVNDGVRVINAGVRGYGLVQMYGRLLRVRDRIRPRDVVVFAPLSLDLLRNLHDPVSFYSYLFSARDVRFPRYASGRVESVAVEGIGSRMLALLLHAPLTGDPSRWIYRAVTGSVEESIREAQAIFEDARRLCDERGASFLAVFLPRDRELRSGRYEVDPASLDHADIRRFFPSDESELSTLSFPGDEHWTPAGHAVAAGAVVAALLERGLVEPADLRAGAVLPRVR